METSLRTLTFAAAAHLCAACTTTTFTKTRDSYVEHWVEKVPEVYIDRLPDEPYEAVGVIQVIAPASATLREVVRAAAQRGQKVGCDVVVDRSIHHVSDARLPRWLVDLTTGISQPPVAEVEPQRRSSLLGFVATRPSLQIVAPSTTVVYQTQTQAAPPEKREFICGMLHLDAEATEQPSGGDSPAPPPRAKLGAPPTGAGGFLFGASADDARHACEQSGHAFTHDAEGPDACDGLPSSIGAPARAELTYCAAKVCEVELSVDAEGGIAPALLRWKTALVERYGPPTSTRSDVPDSCAKDVSPCLLDGSAQISFEWKWPTRESISIEHEVGTDKKARVGITYKAAPGPTAPGL